MSHQRQNLKWSEKKRWSQSQWMHLQKKKNPEMKTSHTTHLRNSLLWDELVQSNWSTFMWKYYCCDRRENCWNGNSIHSKETRVNLEAFSPNFKTLTLIIIEFLKSTILAIVLWIIIVNCFPNQRCLLKNIVYLLFHYLIDFRSWNVI
jgi:hypothetical protein